jgi:hypothetical protein
MIRTTSLRLALPLALVLGAASLGCAHSQGEKVRDARMARVDAQAEARNDAIDKEAKARSEAVEKRFSAEGQAIESSNQAGQEASGELVEVAKQRALYQADAQTKLAHFAVRLESAREKLDILGPKAPSSIQQTLQTATTEHHSLSQDVEKLDKISPDQWGSTKDGVEGRMSTLDQRLDDLNKSIEDV